MSLPYVPGSDTSQAAAESMVSEAARLRDDVRRLIEAAGAEGHTDDELEVQLGGLHQTVSARRRELVQAGSVADSGRRRTTRSGRSAVVWVLASEAPDTPAPKRPTLSKADKRVALAALRRIWGSTRFPQSEREAIVKLGKWLRHGVDST